MMTTVVSKGKLELYSELVELNSQRGSSGCISPHGLEGERALLAKSLDRALLSFTESQEVEYNVINYSSVGSSSMEFKPMGRLLGCSLVFWVDQMGPLCQLWVDFRVMGILVIVHWVSKECIIIIKFYSNDLFSDL